MAFSIPTDAARVLQALSSSQAIIEFDPSGRVLTANENFCNLIGYEAAEIINQHHSIFVASDEAAHSDYKMFWAKLARGNSDRRQYKRLAKGGREIWIEASYNPVSRAGKVYKVVKVATDITGTVIRAAEDAGKVAALSRAQAIIEFTPDGQILGANQNFLQTMGYELEEILGRHHAIFCDEAIVQSVEYDQFWKRLKDGEFIASEFKRVAKDGHFVHIQASYNPIFDETGRVRKVLKFATDVTARVQNVETLAARLNDLAKGDLTKEIEQPFIPSLERLRVDFNTAAQRLCETISAVASNAQAIAASAAEVRLSADDLSRRTDDQAASVEQTAASLEQITTAVADSSRRADDVGHLVEMARVDAQKSGEVVSEAMVAMGAIDVSSRQISGIVGLIEEIAFQTNLLALNAGVEAARAGEAGKGFAVVAQEVRSLAQRSATAAKEIKALIVSSAEQVKRGVTLVDKTGEALTKIVTQVNEISTNVAAIVNAAREQSIGLTEINKAVNVIDQRTQQNAAMVEQTKAASSALSNEAKDLLNLVAQFHVDPVSSARKISPRGARLAA